MMNKELIMQYFAGLNEVMITPVMNHKDEFIKEFCSPKATDVVDVLVNHQVVVALCEWDNRSLVQEEFSAYDVAAWLATQPEHSKEEPDDPEPEAA